MMKFDSDSPVDFRQVAEEARVLLAATADAAGDNIQEARKRLREALQEGRGMMHRVRDQASEGAHLADKAMHAHPYVAIAIGVAIGTLVGCACAQRWMNGNGRG